MRPGAGCQYPQPPAHWLLCEAGVTPRTLRATPGGGPEARDLATRISSAWVQFARTGNPNHGGLPKWPAFDAAKRSTMVFNDTCAVKDDPDGEEQRALDASMKWS